MRKLLLHWPVLYLVLTSAAAPAKPRESEIRNVTLPDEPSDMARPVYAAGGVATVLRFDKEVDPARTQLEGWVGRFEPLVIGGKTVVLVPLYDPNPAERIPFVVTLKDGTQLPFIVTAKEERVDHQVNLFWDHESDKYLRASLTNALLDAQFYREKADRYEQEENSPDHALAALLVSGAVRQTPFNAKKTYIYRDAEVDIVITLYAGRGKAAVLIKLKNHRERAWSLMEARLTSVADSDDPFAKTRKCAVRMAPHAIAPGESGALAIVADKQVFTSGSGLETLALQIIRDDGLVQALVVLDPSLVLK
jgi:uncharacterized protein (TIGR02268 family)